MHYKDVYVRRQVLPSGAATTTGWNRTRHERMARAEQCVRHGCVTAGCVLVPHRKLVPHDADVHAVKGGKRTNLYKDEAKNNVAREGGGKKERERGRGEEREREREGGRER